MARTQAQKLTESYVKTLPRPLSGNRVTYDAELKGFGFRITAAGARAFILNYRIDGRERRFTIGGYPEWSVTAARREAEGLKREIDRGNDPQGEKEEKFAAPTMAELCESFIERHVSGKRPSTKREYQSIVRNIISKHYGKTKVAEVTHDSVRRLHREVSERAPVRANRVVAILSKMFSIAIRSGLRLDNPARSIDRNNEVPRERYLTIDEINRLISSLANHPERPSAQAIMFLLLTGSRRTEVLAARWDQFDFDSGVWVKPASSVKQKRTHRIPLSAQAIVVLKDIRVSATSAFLFPSPDGMGHLKDVRKTWRAILANADIQGCRLHDLRHTFASHLASFGHSLPTIGALLGHTQAQTTLRYAHLFDDPLRAAADQVGSSMTGRGSK